MVATPSPCRGAFQVAALLLLAGLPAIPISARAQATAFTYQGRLGSNGNPASGSFDFQFSLWDAPAAGNPVGTTNIAASVAVTNGFFTAALDFGGAAFNGNARWLQIGVRTNGDPSPCLLLNPRQPVTPAPYALFAASSASSASGLSSSNNLADLQNAAIARSNLGLGTLALQNAAAPVFSNATNYGNLTIGTNAANPQGFLSLADGQQISLGGEQGVIYENNAHPPFGELQITAQGSMSLNMGYNNAGGSVLQLGSSSHTHERIQFQYDYLADATNLLGYSKLVNWVSSYHSATSGNDYDTAYVGAQSYALDQFGNSELRFFNPSPAWQNEGQAQQNNTPLTGGVLQGKMQTNGWLFNGVMDRGLQNLGLASSMNVDFNAADFKQVTLNASPVTFTSANLDKITGGRMVCLRILTLSSSYALSFPAGWTFANSTVPTTLGPGKVALLRLTAFGPTDNQIFAEWNVSDQTFDYDADASAFFTAANITDLIQRSAVNQFVVDLKTHGLWAKLDAVYPFVGGNAAAHGKNLKGATFTITWNGSVTHDANGITGDGLTGYGDTGLTPSTVVASPNSMMFLVNIKSCPAQVGIAYYIGAQDAAPHRAGIYRNGGNLVSSGLDTATVGDAVLNGGSFLGVAALNRTSATFQQLYVSGAAGGGSGAVTGLPAVSVYVGARNAAGSADSFSNATLDLAAVGENLSASDMTQLITDIGNYESALGR